MSSESFVPEILDVPCCSQGVKKWDEPAVRANNLDGSEANVNPGPPVEDKSGFEVLSSENLEPSSGSRDPLARGAVDEFVTPAHYARNTYGSESCSSVASNEQYFSTWFINPWVGKSQKDGFQWSASLVGDDLPAIDDVVS